jgi:O-antigen/teichoic acid export membrane protein
MSPEVFIVLASEKYSEAASFSPIILAGTLVYALSSILNAGLYLRKKTPVMLLIMVCAVGLNIGLNYFLMPRYGVFGGAWTALATSSTVVLLTGIFSSRYLTVRVEISPLIYYFSLSLVMFGAMNLLHFQSAAVTLALKLGVGCLVAGLGIGYWERELMRKLWGWLSGEGKGFDPRGAVIRGR